MKRLVVQTGRGRTQAGAAQDADTLVALWDDWESGPDVVSIPARLHGELLAIRAEHMAWAYDMGRLPVKMEAGPPHELQDWLRCGEEPSMWWCSLLYERHPKMTPQLYTIYKLRCLERLMEAEGCAAVHLVGGDAALRATLAELCAATGRQFSAAAGSASEREPRSLARRLYGLMPAPLRALARYAHW
ncbi:MAG: hypothetical protein K2N07_04630, partial [Desulfovibrio sp.]|nr:hypothetical protein [Desulfovibrio sp.]